jgi:hypothetical protein
MIRSRLAGLLVLAGGAGMVTAACGGSGIPQQVLKGPAPVVPIAPAAANAGPWPYRPSAIRRAYVVEQHALLSVRQDSTTHVDSLSSRAELAFTAYAPTRRVSGMLTLFRAGGIGGKGGSPAALGLPAPFVATYPARGRQLEFSTPDATAPCGSPLLPILEALRDLWVQVPDTLHLGMTWEDSARYTVCRDGIPLQSSVRRVFRVVGTDERGGRPLVTVTRASTSVIAGSGAQSGEAISITGSASAEMTYTLDPTAGEILSAHGSSAVDLVFRSKFRTQVVHQAGDTRIDGLQGTRSSP